jgi:hypothetical protein
MRACMQEKRQGGKGESKPQSGRAKGHGGVGECVSIAGRPVDPGFPEVPEGRKIVAHPDPVGVGNRASHDEKPRQGRHIR